MKTVYVFEKLVNRTFERHIFKDRQNAIRYALNTVKKSVADEKQRHEIMRELETWGTKGPVGKFNDQEGIHFAGSGYISFNLYQGKIED